MSDPQPHAAPDWAQVRLLFEAALPLDAAAREALLADPARPPAQVAEVRSLLQFVAETRAGVLAQGAAALATTVPDDAPTDRSGQRLGAWRVVALLGRGGMGEVWLAERADGAYAGQAAIKVVRAGRSSASVLARFAVEQQALARLSHPHIAHLLDAGRTADGQPYFVMERVSGQPIDQACVGRPLAARLDLFLQLADAVAHAHRQLLVHRDLKPSNVLVTDAGQVKLLDFGIAKALDTTAPAPEPEAPDSARPDDDSALTRAGERPFSPRYASPEQVRGEAVGTATDVYSLGVLLYVMLTGVSPYGRSADTPAAAARSVLDETPTRPSSLPPDLAGADWAALRPRLRGDLDSILLKALAKPIEARYASVDALAADVQAYLAQRPVSARPQRWPYLATRFVQRHRLPVAAASLATLALVAGLAGTLWQAREARLARDAAQRHLAEVRRLANTMVFDVNAALQKGPTEARRQLVKAAAESLAAQQGITEQTDAERIDLAHALNDLARLEGHAFADNVGDKQGARTHYRQALAVLEPLAPRHADDARWHAVMVSALEGLSSIERGEHRVTEAVALMQRAAAHAARAATLNPRDLTLRTFECAALMQSASLLYATDDEAVANRMDDALALLSRTLACSEKLVADFPDKPRAWRTRSLALYRAGELKVASGELSQSVQTQEMALAAVRQAAALPNGALAWRSIGVASLEHLGMAHSRVGQEDQAERYLLESLDLAEKQWQADTASENERYAHGFLVRDVMRLWLRLGRPDEVVALQARTQRLRAAAHRSAGLELPPMETALNDAAAVVAMVLVGRVAEAHQTAAPFVALVRQGQLTVDAARGPDEADRVAMVQAALAALALANRREADALRAAQTCVEATQRMRALRDPRDLILKLTAAEYLVLLDRLPWGPGAEAQKLRASLKQAVADLLTPLADAGVLPLAARVEGRWLMAHGRPPEGPLKAHPKP